MIDPPHLRHLDPDRLLAALKRPVKIPADVFAHRELSPEEEAAAERVMSTFVRELENVAAKETR